LFRPEFSELLDGAGGSIATPLHANEALTRRLLETHERAASSKSVLHSSFEGVYWSTRLLA
jgi:hypothetical protein